MTVATPRRTPLSLPPLAGIAQLIETRVLEPDINPVVAWLVPGSLAGVVKERAARLGEWARASGLIEAMRQIHGKPAAAATPEVGNVRVEHHRDAARHDGSVPGVAQWHRSHSPLRLGEALRLDMCESRSLLVIVARVNHLIADATDAEAVFAAMALFLSGAVASWRYELSVPACETPEYAKALSADALAAELDLDLLTWEGSSPARVGRVKTMQTTLAIRGASFDSLLITCANVMFPTCGLHQVWRYPYVHPHHRTSRGYFSQIRLIGLDGGMSSEQVASRRRRLQAGGWYTEAPDHAAVRHLAALGYPRLVLTDTSFYRGLASAFEYVPTFSESSVDDIRFQLDRRDKQIELRLQYKSAFLDDAAAAEIIDKFDSVAHDLSVARPASANPRKVR